MVILVYVIVIHMTHVLIVKKLLKYLTLYFSLLCTLLHYLGVELSCIVQTKSIFVCTIAL